MPSPLRLALFLFLAVLSGRPALAGIICPGCDGDCAIDETDVELALGALFAPEPGDFCPALVSNANAAGLLGLVGLAAEVNAGPPAIAVPEVYRTYPGYEVVLPVEASDPDQPLSYDAQGLPPGAALESDTGILRWTPSPEQLGPFLVPFLVMDNGLPPLSSAGRLPLRVSPVDGCTTPACDPETGCTSALPPLDTPCCAAGPAARVAEPPADCPGGRVLMIGRNTNSGFGRMQNCDHLRLLALSQEGVTIRINLAARCLTTGQLMIIRTHLETSDRILIAREDADIFQETSSGFSQRISFTLPVLNASMALNDREANLSVLVRDPFTGIEVTETIRVVLTHSRLDDLPDIF